MNRDVEIASDLSNITYIEQLIDEISQNYNLDKDLYGNILISVLEAVTNSIIHGNKNDNAKTVKVNFKGSKTELSFYVEDEGTGFNYLNVPDPTKPVNVEKPHGRGIFLMMKLSDSIEFKNEGRKVILKFNLP